MLGFGFDVSEARSKESEATELRVKGYELRAEPVFGFEFRNTRVAET